MLTYLNVNGKLFKHLTWFNLLKIFVLYFFLVNSWSNKKNSSELFIWGDHSNDTVFVSFNKYALI